jgi:Flp pilus assembly protein TadG
MTQVLNIGLALTVALSITLLLSWMRRLDLKRNNGNVDAGVNRGLGRRIRQRGSELVEMSFVAVPLFGLTFLILDVSMVIFLRSTFQQAVREGVRYAITGANDTGPCQDDSIKAVVKKNAVGFLGSTAGAATIHVHFMSPVNGSVTNNAYGNIVEVSVEGYSYGVMAPYQKSSSPLQMTARAYDMMEALPGALPCITKSE